MLRATASRTLVAASILALASAAIAEQHVSDADPRQEKVVLAPQTRDFIESLAGAEPIYTLTMKPRASV